MSCHKPFEGHTDVHALKAGCKMILTRTCKALFACSLALLTAACGESSEQKYDQAFDRGYSDGYAVGYNTACEIRATLIEGDWGNSGYSAGYAAGNTDGTIACSRDRR